MLVKGPPGYTQHSCREISTATVNDVNRQENVVAIAITTDGLALLGTRTSVGKAMPTFESRTYTRALIEGFKLMPTVTKHTNCMNNKHNGDLVTAWHTHRVKIAKSICHLLASYLINSLFFSRKWRRWRNGRGYEMITEGNGDCSKGKVNTMD